MTRLSDKDLSAVLGAIRTLYESADVNGFAGRAAEALLRVIPADRCSYNEWFSEPRKFRSLIGPTAGSLSGSLGEAMAQHGHQNPLLSYYRQTRRLDVVSFSDFVSRAQLHRTGLYNEYYRHVDVEHQIIVPLQLGAGSMREVGLALSRRSADFNEGERQVLELLQPHLAQAYANALAVERGKTEQSVLEKILEAGGRAIIVLAPDGRVVFMTANSAALLADYAGDGSRGRLPDTLARWVRRQTMRRVETEIEEVRKPLVIERDRGELTITLNNSGENYLLLLEERAANIDPRSLAPLGLTPRQSEVLAWVARGKTNEEIALIAGARPATVAKHLERIYQKLGVETRTAAAIEALGIAGRGRMAV